MQTILLIDNTIDVLDCLSAILQRNGFKVIATTVQQAANTRLESTLPDLIIIDIKYHDNSGKDLCKSLKSKYPDIPILLTSTSPKMLGEFADCKADDVIEKPFDLKTLIGKVNSLIAHITKTP